MKKAEQIKVGDDFWMYSNKNGFERLGRIITISKPDKSSNIYQYYLDNNDIIGFWPGARYDIDHEFNWYYIVPDDDDEIKFLNELLSVQFKKSQSFISGSIKSILGIES